MPKKMHLPECKIILLWAMATLAGGGAAKAQTTPTLTVTVSPKEVVTGTTIEVTYKLDGDNQGILKPPAFGAFKSTGSAHKLNGTSILNGKVTSYCTWTYTLMAPGKPGTYVLPGASATARLHSADEITVSSEAITIKVTEARAFTPPPGKAVIPPGADENLFVYTTITDKSVYPGQQFICQVRIYTRISIENFDIIELPSIENGYAVEMKRFDNQTRFVKIKGQEYATRALYTAAIFPQKEGEVRIKPAKVRVGLEVSGGFGFEQRVLNTPLTVVKVNALPQPAPPDFTGVVGSYDVLANVDRTSIAVGDGITLNLEVRGNGDGKKYKLPVITLPDQLETFDPQTNSNEEYENGEYWMHSGKYSFLIQAKDTGAVNLSPSLSWFDPDSNKYVRWNMQPVALTISNQVQTPEPVPPVPVTTTTTNNWWPPSPKATGIASLLLAFLITVLWFVLSGRKNSVTSKKQEPVLIQPQSVTLVNPAPQKDIPPVVLNAEMPLYPLLRMLEDGAAPRLFFESAYNTLKVYFGQSGLNANELSAETIRRRLTETGISEDRTAELLRAWEHCETALFTGYAPQEWMTSVYNDMKGHKKSA